ncbi:MAG: RnfABCDGE type electron transport complex subunit D [Bacteroidales bacterium]|nr:RnfABCDGE type electron transport complex subunit D [Bacteroidales bacterium]
MKQLIVSPAPHAHSGDSVRKNMLLVIAALMPAYIVSVIEFGWGALITTAISVAACVAFEWLIAKFILKQKPTICDCSAILTGLLLAFNLPSNLPWWIVIIGALVAIGVGKMTFGGLGQNPFNPALVGRVFLLISFPVQMTTWPRPLSFGGSYVDAATGATPLALLKQAIKGGDSSVVSQLPDLWDAFVGAMGGSLGEVCALALLVGGIFLICTRVITWHIPVSILATVALFAAITGWCGALPEGMTTGQYVAMTLCTGGMMLGAFFMATDYVTSPMTGWGKIIFGIGIGLIVMVIRTWGAYPEGMSFAILIMNACVPLLNHIRPKRFGEKKK